MWSIMVSRNEFVEVIGHIEAKRPLLSFAPRELRRHNHMAVPPQMMSLVWEDRPIENSVMFPVVIITNQNDLADFLAWISTFFVSFRPFTSFMRVVSDRQWSQLAEASARPRLGVLEGPFIGAILGEALTHKARREDRSNVITSDDVFSTKTYALARCLSIYRDPSLVEECTRAWEFVHRLGLRNVHEQNRKSSKISSDGLNDVLTILKWIAMDTLPSDSRLIQVFDACSEVFRQGDITEYTLNSLSDGTIDGAILHRMKTDRRDYRVRMFEEAVRRMESSRSENTAFILGYFASLISDGSLGHFDMLGPLLKSHPTALMWYAICSGARRAGAGMGFIGMNIGRQIVRELERPMRFEDRPTADIGYLELEILLRSQTGMPDFLKERFDTIKVELLPGVTCVVPFEGSSASATSKVEGLATDTDQAIARLYEQMGRDVERVISTYKIMGGFIQQEQKQSADKSKRVRKA